MTMYEEFMNNQEQWESSQDYNYASLAKAKTMMLFAGTRRSNR